MCGVSGRRGITWSSCANTKPLNKAFGALDEEGRQALEGDLLSLVEDFHTSVSSSERLHADYLETVATTSL